MGAVRETREVQVAYATEADIVELYGAHALAAVADRDYDGAADNAAVARALDDASGEMDLYIGAAYPLPLAAEVPALRQPCIDIAVYRLASSNGAVLTEEIRKRFDDAMKLLEKIASGKAKLTLPPDPDPDPDDPLDGQGPRPVVISGPERLFSREKMRDL